MLLLLLTATVPYTLSCIIDFGSSMHLCIDKTMVLGYKGTTIKP